MIFRALPEKSTTTSSTRERSARKTSVFNQKTMFLGYAHSSIIYIKFYCSLRSQKRRGGSFFGLCPKNEPHSPLLRAKRAIKLK
ncbi:MAG: hypothetical protein U5L45_22765 [Saprospiraceae bacterium]|nr:hypothetical protein [Saprospiraceae bacterium]